MSKRIHPYLTEEIDIGTEEDDGTIRNGDEVEFSVEVEGTALAIAFTKRLDPTVIETNLDRLIRIRELMPDYLFTGV